MKIVAAVLVSFSLGLAPGSTCAENHTAAPALPPRIIDSHHHFLDFAQNNFSSWIGNLFGPFAYFPEDYVRDVTVPLNDVGVELGGTVHIDVLADAPFGGVEEAQWVQDMVDSGRAPMVKAIVGSCDIGDETNVAECLSRMSTVPLVKGIRWIIDYVGPFNGQTATHVNALRSDVDYLRGGANGGPVASFEDGYAQLADYGWSFDAQLAPEQLPALAVLAGRHPDVPVVIDHIGKPRQVLGPYSNYTSPDEDVLKEWREGMRLMAEIPHAYVKLSMLGYAVPDWVLDPTRAEVVKSLVLETVELFGPKRCMVGLNWFLGDSISDNDGLGTKGPSPVEFTEHMSEWLAEYSEEEREWMFAKTAETFYKFGSSDATQDDATTAAPVETTTTMPAAPETTAMAPGMTTTTTTPKATTTANPKTTTTKSAAAEPNGDDEQKEEEGDDIGVKTSTGSALDIATNVALLGAAAFSAALVAI